MRPDSFIPGTIFPALQEYDDHDVMLFPKGEGILSDAFHGREFRDLTGRNYGNWSVQVLEPSEFM